MLRLTSVILVFVLAANALAADASNEEAKGHVRQATAAYNLGNYLEAAKEYEAAYRQTLDANLLFNIGQAYRLGGDGDKAITAYRSFIRSAPRSEQRGLAEAKIRELEEQRDARAPASATALPPSTATVPPPPVSTPPATAPAAAASTTDPVARVEPRPALDLSAQPAPAPAPPAPYYKRWPFWTAIGVAVVGAAVAGIVILDRHGNDLNMGNPSFGTKEY